MGVICEYYVTFHVWDLSIWFWYPWGSWNQSPTYRGMTILEYYLPVQEDSISLNVYTQSICF